MKYISKKNVEILDRLSDQAEHHYRIRNRLRDNCDRLPDHFKAKGEAYYDGMLQATYGSIQIMLSELKAYNGFNYRYPDNCPDGLETYFYSVKPKPHGAHLHQYRIVKFHLTGIKNNTLTTETMTFVSHNAAQSWRDNIRLNCDDYAIQEMDHIN